jgi:glutamyl/glutaminyl-tRNA synthetase
LPEDVRNSEIQHWLLNDSEISKYEKINDEEFMSKIYPIIFDRISKWSDIHDMIRAGEIGYFFSTPEYDAEKLVWKDADRETTRKHLEWIRTTLGTLTESDYSSVDSIKASLFEYATENGRGQVLWPTRFALSGQEKSPDPFTLIYIFGRGESIKRIAHALEKLS